MKEQMKILVFARHPSGGIRTYFRYVYGDEAMSHLSLSVVAPGSAELDQVLQNLQTVRFVSQSRDSLSSLFVSLIRILIRERFDIIHSHGFTAGLVAALPARLLGVAHVLTTHDVFQKKQFPGLKGKIKKIIIGRLLRLMTVINPVGEDAKSNLIETYPSLNRTGKIKAIRNGIDSETFLIDGVRHLRDEQGIPTESVLLGFFGRFMAQKGFGTLVKAVQRWNADVSRTPLHVACFGWGGFIREEQAEIASKGLGNFFHFFPATDDMALALRGVDAVVMPSRWEACPLLPMEAMVAGVPIIGTDCVGMREISADSPVKTFAIDSVEGLTSRIQELELNREKWKVESEKFRAEAAQRFDSGGTAKRLSDLFGQIDPL